MKACRCIIAAVFAFYSLLSGFGDGALQLGLPAPAMALPMSIPILDRSCTGTDQKFMLVADTDTTVRITNSTTGRVNVIGIDAAREQQFLTELRPGEVRAQRIPPGIVTLGFAQDDKWLGDGYAVTGASGEAVTVPYAAPEAEAEAPANSALSDMQARQQGEGSIELSFSNTTADAATVVVVDDDNNGFALFDVPAGETVLQRALPQAKLWFYKSGSQDVIGGPYEVAGLDGEAVTIAPAAAQPEVSAPSAMQLYQSGEGSVELAFTNTTADAATVVAVDEDTNGYALFDVPAGASIAQRAQPGAKLWFYKSGTQDVISGPYEVIGIEGEAVTIAPQAAEPEAPALSAAQQKQSGEGSVKLSFTNTTADLATVVVVDDENNGDALFVVPAGETVQQRVLPQAKLWFFKAGTQDVIGGPYVVEGLVGESVAIAPNAAPAAAELTPLQIQQSGEGSVELSFTNTTDVAVIGAALNEANEPEAIFTIPAGETTIQRALPGTVLRFYREDTSAVAGSPYKVRGTPGESISLPFDALAFAKAEQSGLGSVEVEFSNRRSHAVTVSVVGPDERRADLDEVPALGSKRVRLLPGTEAWFFRSGTDEPEGEKVAVAAQTGPVAIPHLANLAAAGNASTIRFGNKADFDITAETLDPQGFRAPVFDVPAGGENSAALPPETVLYFFKRGTEEPVPDAYVVPQTAPDLVTLPYVRLNAEAARQAGPGSIEVRFVNTTSESVAVTTLALKEEAAGAPVPEEATEQEAAATAERVTLYNIPAGQTMTRRLQPGAAVWFYRGDSQDFSGRSLPYFVRGRADEAVTLPYNPTDAEILELTDISIQQIVDGFVDKAELAKLSNSGPKLCWKDSYGRGVGTIPRSCPAGQEEATAGLCYDKCQAGYKGAVTMCVPSCPAGFRDDGLYCYKPAPYNKTSYAWKIGDGFNMNGALARCRASAEGRKYGCGVYNSNTMVYTECPSGFRTIPGLNFVCSPICPSNTIDIGISCQKRTYDRGVGKLMSCEPGKHWDAGLCYDQCKPKYAGVGPVCWNDCPAEIGYNCGAMCARDKSTCDTILAEQVLSPVLAVGSIALTVVTAGGATAATASAKAGATVAKAGAQVAAKAAAKATAKQALKASVRKALDATAKLGVSGAKHLAIDTAISLGFASIIFGGQNIAAAVGRRQMRDQLHEIVPKQIVGEVSDERIEATVEAMMQGAEKNSPGVDFPYTALDPTGIADIVVAYNYPICSDLPPPGAQK